MLHTADTGNMTADEDASALVVEPEAAHLERPRHSMEESFLLEVDPVTFAGVDHVSDPRIAGTWLGVLEGVAEIGATGATTVVLPCAMLRGDGLGVQVCSHAVTVLHSCWLCCEQALVVCQSPI